MGDVSSEPTMEEILSSIKRVIEESEAASPAPRPRRVGRSATTATGPMSDIARSEVLELHDRAPFADAPRVAPAPRAEYAPETFDRPAPRAEAESVPDRDSILSSSAAEASRGPLEALSRMVVKPEIAADNTLEGMVRDMLRPMLRDWLDAQLPGIVEAMVAKEIARISGRGL